MTADKHRAAAKRSVGEPPVSRDDRTVRALTCLLGEDRADVALTHFMRSRVDLEIHELSLRAPNAWVATRLALNMLTRFVGRVDLRVFGDPDSDLRTRLDREIRGLGLIDTRPGHRLAWALGPNPDEDPLVVRIGMLARGLGAPTPGRAGSGPPVIALGFDGWTCHVSRLDDDGEMPVTASEVPFGAMAGACFAVAEVFKSLIAAAVGSDQRPNFERRFTHDWRYSVWTQVRWNIERDGEDGGAGPDPLPTVSVDDVLQVGAGAVGNAAAFALAATIAARGYMPLMDTKVVDEKNLNRCVYFRETDVGDPKVVVVAREAARTELTFEALNEPYSDARGRGARVIL